MFYCNITPWSFECGPRSALECIPWKIVPWVCEQCRGYVNRAGIQTRAFPWQCRWGVNSAEGVRTVPLGFEQCRWDVNSAVELKTMPWGYCCWGLTMLLAQSLTTFTVQPSTTLVVHGVYNTRRSIDQQHSFSRGVSTKLSIYYFFPQSSCCSSVIPKYMPVCTVCILCLSKLMPVNIFSTIPSLFVIISTAFIDSTEIQFFSIHFDTLFNCNRSSWYTIYKYYRESEFDGEGHSKMENFWNVQSCYWQLSTESRTDL